MVFRFIPSLKIYLTCKYTEFDNILSTSLSIVLVSNHCCSRGMYPGATSCLRPLLLLYILPWFFFVESRYSTGSYSMPEMRRKAVISNNWKYRRQKLPFLSAAHPTKPTKVRMAAEEAACPVPPLAAHSVSLASGPSPWFIFSKTPHQRFLSHMAERLRLQRRPRCRLTAGRDAVPHCLSSCLFASCRYWGHYIISPKLCVDPGHAVLYTAVCKAGTGSFDIDGFCCSAIVFAKLCRHGGFLDMHWGTRRSHDLSHVLLSGYRDSFMPVTYKPLNA